MELLTQIATETARDFSRLNGGRALTTEEAAQLVTYITHRTTAGKQGAFVGQSYSAAVAAAVAARA